MSGEEVDRLMKQFEGFSVPRVSVLSLILPEGLLANNPTETRTVVLLDWSRNFTGAYVSSRTSLVSKGYSVNAEMTIIDRNRHLYWHAPFDGAVLPKEISFPYGSPGYGDLYGSLPTREIITYLNGLPRCVE